MKKITYILLLAVFTISCSSKVAQIGRVNMISNRNVNPDLKYQILSTYAGGSDREVKKSTSTSIENAIDQTVRKVPGGEFVMNAKIYLVDGKYLAVEGDVWGTGERSHKGFKVGDLITWKTKSVINGTKYLTGIITALKDDKICFVKIDSTGKTDELSYDDITKTNK